jgi:hypothetical protein
VLQSLLELRLGQHALVLRHLQLLLTSSILLLRRLMHLDLQQLLRLQASPGTNRGSLTRCKDLVLVSQRRNTNKKQSNLVDGMKNQHRRKLYILSIMLPRRISLMT